MEVASGEHGEAVYKLVNAVNNGKCSNYSQENVLLSVVQSNDKIMNKIFVATTSTVEPSCGILTHDSVIVDVDLIRNASNSKPANDYTIVKMNSSRTANEQPQQSIGPTSSLLESSTESVMISKKHLHVHGFPTSSWTQFWILLKRTFLTIIRDQTLTQMRLVVSLKDLQGFMPLELCNVKSEDFPKLLFVRLANDPILSGFTVIFRV